jgi:D-arabinose 1-dehydrogenase-like Zn-dependent alcohol dehydrogenase
MRAMVLGKLGGPEELVYREASDPVAGAGEVLVRVKAEGVCGRDLIDRRGGFRGLKLPVILGHEFAGEVVAVGAGVTSLSLGDRVANLLRLFCGECPSCRRGETPVCEKAWESFGQTRDGGYAELVTSPASALVKVPSEISFVEAAPVACTFGVALRALRTAGQVTLGDRVLITGASGGVGMAAIQVAKALGALVIAATSSASKRQALLDGGADDVVVDAEGNLHTQVRALAPAGVDVALELTGSPTFTSSMRSLRNGGKLVLVGNILADSIKLNPGAVILFGYQILGSAGCTRTDLEDAFAMLSRKKAKMVIGAELPLGRATEAHEMLANRKAVGRVVLVP